MYPVDNLDLMVTYYDWPKPYGYEVTHFSLMGRLHSLVSEALALFLYWDLVSTLAIQYTGKLNKRLSGYDQPFNINIKKLNHQLVEFGREAQYESRVKCF